MNVLNQFTNATRSGTFNLTVNGLSAEQYPDSTFASSGHTLADGTDTFTVVAQDTLRQVTNTAVTFWPATQTFSYDANGNLLSDGQRAFAYDDENQLISVTVTNQWKSEFLYDGKMRRRVRKEYRWNVGTWLLTNEVRYVYDGNLVIQERNASNVPKVTYTRGRDMSGSFEGAGGIGGLLARTENASPLSLTPATHAYYHADGNGNVTMLIDAQQAVVAKYLYDPFGNLLSATGPLAEANLYRFSSKEFHPNSGLAYYLYRYYEPNLQRWINRDPFADSGFQELLNANLSTPKRIDNGNLYAFVDNTPNLFTDAFGLVVFKGCMESQKEAIKKALKNSCDKAKECAKKCPHSDQATAGITKLCDDDKYQVNCVHKDNEHCQKTPTGTGCGYAPVGGNELNICPGPFKSQNPDCGGPGCVLFHEALHSGGLSHTTGHPSDFNDLETCMGCPLSPR